MKVTTGMAGMIGLHGKAQTAIAPEGTIFVRGELWRARYDGEVITPDEEHAYIQRLLAEGFGL